MKLRGFTLAVSFILKPRSEIHQSITPASTKASAGPSRVRRPTPWALADGVRGLTPTLASHSFSEGWVFCEGR
ncbi:MAG: hypothetical protein A2939_02955 [Parcubacteria group bacterium RIFCSPLOWO2_01_FULL_48_18]|nr:MAG: hypothetical protein A2939_02955 [Parcubacteria group bacterium RIFCSPLOWO2_01_FULL_48_18]OHB24471.1 MAG: hypothetical protein A3J67_05545 [Parcubacteria group bacterium RIFCSPHIGHO2_02_FULL_48_10b]